MLSDYYMHSDVFNKFNHTAVYYPTQKSEKKDIAYYRCLK